MKRALLILCVLAFAAMSVACSKATNNSQRTANQEAFLKDMAAGITKRLNDDRNEANMSAEEVKAFYSDLVGYELSYIEKYAETKFEDVKFNTLAHRYIEACLMQQSALDFSNNNDLYQALWMGGRTVRSGIIIAMYELYNLNLSSEQIDGYRASDSASISLSTDNDVYDEASAIHVSKKNPNPVIYNDKGIKITVKSCTITWQNYEIKFLIENNGDKEVSAIIQDVTINNFEIPSANDYASVAPGNSGFSTGYISLSDLEEAGIGNNFDEITCNIWLNDGTLILPDNYAKLPATIDRNVFRDE